MQAGLGTDGGKKRSAGAGVQRAVCCVKSVRAWTGRKEACGPTLCEDAHWKPIPGVTCVLRGDGAEAKGAGG